MVNIMSQSGHTTYNLKEYVIDTPDDVALLPLDVPAGSVALCISTSDVYMINSKHEWSVI